MNKKHSTKTKLKLLKYKAQLVAKALKQAEQHMALLKGDLDNFIESEQNNGNASK